MARPPTEQLTDDQVSDSLDRELRTLLTICFTRPQDEVFRHRRYWKEPPRYRWIMRNAGGDLIAHAAAHDKLIAARPEGGDEVELRVAGMAEVMVHPAARGMGHVTELLGVAHPALERMGFEFSVLFGRPVIYRSSGYRIAENPIRYYDDQEGDWRTERFQKPERSFMYRPLIRSDWPVGIIDIRGSRF